MGPVWAQRAYAWTAFSCGRVPLRSTHSFLNSRREACLRFFLFIAIGSVDQRTHLFRSHVLAAGGVCPARLAWRVGVLAVAGSERRASRPTSDATENQNRSLQPAPSALIAADAAILDTLGYQNVRRARSHNDDSRIRS